jgi:HD-GYP domain-containing protein (c-di-GMP phosphodiesterase class II)
MFKFRRENSAAKTPKGAERTLSAMMRDCESEAAMIDDAEGYRAPHANRIADLADQLAVAFGFDDQARYEIRLAALLHDVGEVMLQLKFLQAARPLTFPERQELWRHPVIGEQYVLQQNLPPAVGLLIRWHHENWDGFGYPDGLRGEDIPLGARILRVADVWRALTTDRPYRAAYRKGESVEFVGGTGFYRLAYRPSEAVECVLGMCGFELDPKIVACLLGLASVQEEITNATADKADDALTSSPQEDAGWLA